jgi:hypothetical protein
MSEFTIKSGSYCPVCKGVSLSDCTHNVSALGHSEDLQAQLSEARASLEMVCDALEDVIEFEDIPPRWWVKAAHSLSLAKAFRQQSKGEDKDV